MKKVAAKKVAAKKVAAKKVAAKRAPDFVLPDESGTPVSLAQFRGQRVLLFFFQKASTPGCRQAACEFRDAMPVFDRAKVQVLAASPDGWRRHANFKKKHALPFPLLSDKDARLCRALRIWKKKIFFGHHYMGVERSTFLVSPAGSIEMAWRGVPYAGHAAEVAAWVVAH